MNNRGKILLLGHTLSEYCTNKVKQKKQIDQFFLKNILKSARIPFGFFFGGSKSCDIEGIKFEHLYAYSRVKLI